MIHQFYAQMSAGKKFCCLQKSGILVANGVNEAGILWFFLPNNITNKVNPSPEKQKKIPRNEGIGEGAYWKMAFSPEHQTTFLLWKYMPKIGKEN